MPDIHEIRTWVNTHGTIVAASFIALAALVVVSSHFLGKPSHPAPPTHCFFVDEVTGEAVVEPIDAIPPLPGKDGSPTLVRAVYYTLGRDDEKQLAYMEKHSEEGRAAAVARASDPNIMGPPPQLLVRGPEAGSKWVLRDSEEGMKVMNVLNEQLGKPGFRVVMPK